MEIQSAQSNSNIQNTNRKRATTSSEANTTNKRPKIQSIGSKTLERFELVEDDTGKKMYKCSLCAEDANPFNGTKVSNLTLHLKKKHKKLYYDEIETNFKEPIQVKRLRLLQNAVEIISVNGRPFNYLLDSGYQAGIRNKLHKLQRAGIGLDFSDHFVEIKEYLSKMAENVRIVIKKELKMKPISLMADICTKNNRSMFGLSAQFIVDGKVQIRSLGLIELDKAHTGVYLANVLRDCLAKYEIDKWQVQCMTTDNGKNMKKMIRDFNQMLASNAHNVNDDTDTNTSNHISENRTNDNERTDEEIQQILAETNDITDDDAIDIILHQQQLERNSNLLSSLSTNFIGTDMIWDTTDVNCVVHTLQLGIKDACGWLSIDHNNVINLAREIAKFLRNPSNRREVEEKGHKIPRLECATRWCSLCMMVSINIKFTHQKPSINEYKNVYV